MTDNVFDKLDEQAKVLARIDKNTSDNSYVVDEMLGYLVGHGNSPF